MDGCYTVVCEENAAIRSYLDGAGTAVTEAVVLGAEAGPLDVQNEHPGSDPAPFREATELEGVESAGASDYLPTVEVSEHGTQTDFTVDAVLPV